MLYLITGLILIIIIVISYGAWNRKKTYGAIDRAEEKRTSLAALPLAGEIAKIKQLKMAGDTEKKFEQWRRDWDSIVTAELPSIEKHLFEAEELTDKYRFKKASDLVTELNDQMDRINEKTDRILKEINMVVESESKNRKDVTPIKEAYHQIKKLMITKRSQFRQALPLLEASVKDIDDQYEKYGSETGNGNYIEARDILLQVKSKIEEVKGQIEKVPDFYEEILQSIPDQLRELSQGKTEMEEQGYSLTHLQIDTLIKETEKQLQVLRKLVDKLELDQTAAGLNGVHDQLDWLYGQLDKEVDSRRQVIELLPEVGSKLEKTGTRLESVTRSMEGLRDSYQIREEDLNAQREVGRTYQKLQKSFNETDDLLSRHTEASSLALDQLKK
jgi:Negative regulator of septation ring formation